MKEQNQAGIVFSLAGHYMLHRGNENERDFFLFNTNDGKVFRLNEVSYTMLEAFDGEKVYADVIKALGSRMAVGADILQRDLSSLVHELVSEGILTAEV